MGFVVVDERAGLEGNEEEHRESEKVDLGKLTAETAKAAPIWQKPGNKLDLGNALEVAGLAKRLMPNLGGYAKHMEEFERISKLHSNVSDRIDELSALSDFREDLKQYRKIPVEPPEVVSLSAHRDRRKEEHQEELIAVLKAQNEKSAALIELNESAFSHAMKSSRSNTWLTGFSILISLAVLIFTVYAYFSPPASPMADELPASNASLKSEGVTVSENPAAKDVTSEREVIEEQAPPQPSPTAAHAPADNAPSSSDQRAP